MKDIRPIKWLIVGAGPAGLSAAASLEARGERDLLILEASDRPGGLSASFVDDRGFTWDVGGHVMFSHYREYDRLLDSLLSPEEWVPHRQEAWIRFSDALVPYPFQLHLNWLPPGPREECLRGLAAAREVSPPTASDFREWIRSRFGTGIARLFMEPYNRNLWSCPLEEMGIYWLGDRVALPSAEMLQAGTRRQWGPNAAFRFPVRGGTGAVWKALADRIGPERIAYGAEAERIDLSNRCLTLADGRRFRWEKLFSSMPLDEFILRAAPGVRAPDSWSADLRSAPIAVVGLGFEGPRQDLLGDFTWMYFPEAKTRIYRVTNFSRYSPANVPDPDRNWSLMAEVASIGAAPDPAGIVKEVETDLAGYGLIPGKARVVSRWSRIVTRGYPVPTVTRERTRLRLLEQLESRGVYSRGRFGAWRYEVGNMDHCAMQGVEWAERMISGFPEVTAVDPDSVNSGKFKQ
ncbi:MAG TPA: FAD-dependent oxidoreductase [bacterium]|nr:FAD-dependent oxidoreductase [bacterium]HPJ71211.1 FAD-dependent oxidoreductase [bacterium]HPQ65199.1 FAD-dependent oxidoreductase [bacterium]